MTDVTTRDSLNIYEVTKKWHSLLPLLISLNDLSINITKQAKLVENVSNNISQHNKSSGEMLG